MKCNCFDTCPVVPQSGYTRLSIQWVTGCTSRMTLRFSCLFAECLQFHCLNTISLGLEAAEWNYYSSNWLCCCSILCTMKIAGWMPQSIEYCCSHINPAIPMFSWGALLNWSVFNCIPQETTQFLSPINLIIQCSSPDKINWSHSR